MQDSLTSLLFAATALLSTGLSIQPLPATAQELPKASITLVRQAKDVRIYTLLTPDDKFANTSHIIELPTQLIVVDGQFFVPYAQQLKAFTDGLNKPVTRFYISHEHPDHYIGFGDTFPDVAVYALAATKQAIEQNGPATLAQRQNLFGPLIAHHLNVPTHVQQPGREVIDGVPFVFEESLDNESPASLVIKLPTARTYIAQDIVFNHAHLFLSDDNQGWRDALNKLAGEKDYDLILAGHGKPADPSIIQQNLAYLDLAEKALAESETKDEFKAKLLAAYPDYAGRQFIDIYLKHGVTNKVWKTQ